MAELVEYKPGTPFPGVIGRTVDESSPAWPSPSRAKEGSPNVVFIVMDDTGYGQMSPFGGLVNTPNIDKLATGGLSYTDMHTTALCSPSRTCIITGRNHHSNGMAAIAEMSTGYPGYNGTMPFEHGFLSEILLEQGYNTYALGKWHLTSETEGTAAGPFHRWPLGRGFERYYGFLGGETNQWYPDLINDNHSVNPPSTPEEGYHLTPDLVDHAISFFREAKVNAPEKPFFMYFCPGAAHAPHHVPKEWADKYKGKFDMGWDKMREQIFANQKKLGLFPADAELSRHDPDVPEWGTLSDDQKRVYTRFMEVFAGFLEHADHHIGRLLDALDEAGELDNTLLMVISDNGASSEGSVNGEFNEMSSFNYIQESIESILPRVDELGGIEAYNHYPWGWAWAGNTPFKRWKKEVYRGGSTDPFIVHWPKGIKAKGELRTQYAHAIDMVPTVLDALGIELPATIRGVTQDPMHGVSFAHTFEDAKAATKHHTQYFEMFGTRAIYHDGWRAVCGWPGPSYAEGAKKGHEVGGPITGDILNELDANGWELYHVDKDPAEVHDLADKHPVKLQEMIARWYVEAGKYDVMPIDGSLFQRISTTRPAITKDRTTYKYYPGLGEVPMGNCPPTFNRPFSITAEVDIPTGGAEGVLLAQGGVTGGYAFYVQDKKLHYLYNYAGTQEFVVTSDADVPEGKVTLRYEFEPTEKADVMHGKGTPGNGTLHINGKLVGAVALPVTLPVLFGIEGLSCGYDFGERVTHRYDAPFTFTGEIGSVTVDLAGELTKDSKAELKRLMAQQ